MFPAGINIAFVVYEMAFNLTSLMVLGYNEFKW